MSLLREQLPVLTLRPDVAPSEFFDRCEQIAADEGYREDRRRQFAGPECDQLNLYLGSAKGDPMLRMVSSPPNPQTLTADVVTRWNSSPVAYEEYVPVVKAAYRELLTLYAAKYGKRLRLGTPRRPTVFDPATVDCNTIDYPFHHLEQAVRGMATGPGDVRARLKSAYESLHVIRPSDLPPPLDEHMQWVFDQLTHRKARHRWEGTVAATTGQMKCATGVKIAERILAISDALGEIQATCQEQG